MRRRSPSDILWWFADGARIPADFLRTYGDLLLGRNLLAEAGGVELRGVCLDLGKVLMISLKDDHVSAWEARRTFSPDSAHKT
jgi:polyhydroxyalkanoate synthase